MSQELLVVINGPMGSGKSTVAEGLEESFHFERVSIGTPIKKVATLLIDQPDELKIYLTNVLKGEDKQKLERVFENLLQAFHEKFSNALWEKNESGEYHKNESYRDLTQFVATYFRDLYSEDIWVRFIAADAMELAEQGKRVVCDDLRLPSEKRIFEMFGFTTLRLDISKQEQKKRLDDLYGEISEELHQHPTEVALNQAHFDCRISVDGKSIEEVRQEVYQYLKLV